MIEIEIDRLTNSIVNAVTGDVFDTEVLIASLADIKKNKKGWNFDWIKESFKSEVFKLVIVGNRNIIQGFVAMQDNKDHIYMPLIESAPFNIGNNKMYEGVPGNLVAFVCKASLEKGYGGFVSFHAKTELIEHYQKTLGAKRFGNGLLMILDEKAAKNLIERYFKS